MILHLKITRGKFKSQFLAKSKRKVKQQENKREKKERKKEVRLEYKKKNENYISKNEKKKLRIIQEDNEDYDQNYSINEEEDFEDKSMTFATGKITKKNYSFGYEYESQNTSSSKTQSFTYKKEYEEATVLQKHSSFQLSNKSISHSNKDSLSPNKSQDK